MKKNGCLLLFAYSLLSFSLTAATIDETYDESLFIKSFSSRYSYVSFAFEIGASTDSTHSSVFSESSFSLFPLSIARVMDECQVSELHIRATRGRWDYENWKESPDNGFYSGGLGFEVWAFMANDPSMKYWLKLTNQLSGLLCASLNYIDSSNTYQPQLSYPGSFSFSNNTQYFASLPQEDVCTENLSPLFKLLPCKRKAGIASLLDSHLFFDTDWHSFSIDVYPSENQSLASVKMGIIIQAVVDVERNGRRKGKTTFQPPSEYCHDEDMDSLHCLMSGYSTEHHTVDDLFHKVPKERCLLSSTFSDVFVSNGDKIDTFSLDEAANIQIPIQSTSDNHTVTVDRSLSNDGNHWGSLSSTIYNPSSSPRTIVYFEKFPWFVRVYLHTLTITLNGTRINTKDFIEKLYYQPLRDRKAGTMMEIQFSIPPHTNLIVHFNVEKTPLRLDEYPPDANRGYNLPPAIISVFDENNTKLCSLRTAALLMFIPTPDFSMPYNVIIFTSTVIALTFGGIFNLLTRRFVPQQSKFQNRQPSMLQRLKEKIFHKKRG
ncbi:pig-T, Gpi16 [Schizosaccharomyces pombe]|uniref:GPI transamidase component PIG-T homolog n=1 Tax=Schizosaccharomyces pombe (strain 972 / ATCC 24843) TaxID=284812 RepID=GPI16_SCHPO|nr:putative pig-T family GPI synthesis protein [Schizosaccharomyces pombe]O94380.1 RecName: Full=GPI transamidase component PIG-T homolog; Flags: Precursor [Schizosaccharomyces pombe 972h-]CAA22348.1 pig-T (predicted) [Schizosaccharomyces pombe]|eukprot:NP_596625.1 putative pig-T family GPI synthesis protein [Schizosaccharomyces pombe]